jgi:predicted metal-dependent HD superfamily phosphohydrolase
MSAASTISISTRERQDLAALFERDVRVLGATRNIAAVFDRLMLAYGETHRAYHTITHISHGLRLYEELVLSANAYEESRALVLVAYWFHDAVYAQGLLATNEAQSAKLLRDACEQMGIGGTAPQTMAEFILSTKKHELITGGTFEEPKLHAWTSEMMIDIDLAILGTDAYTFAKFERDVRAEYNWVPLESLYMSGRKKVIAGFLSRSHIYYQPKAYVRFEAAARRNMERLLRDLAPVASRDPDVLEAPRVRLDATEVGLFTVRAGRLEQTFAWRDILKIVVTPSHDGPMINYELYFRFEENKPVTVFVVPIDDPDASEIVALIRKIPGLDLGAEDYARHARRNGPAYDARTAGRISAPVGYGNPPEAALPFR